MINRHLLDFSWFEVSFLMNFHLGTASPLRDGFLFSGLCRLVNTTNGDEPVVLNRHKVWVRLVLGDAVVVSHYAYYAILYLLFYKGIVELELWLVLA